MYCRKCGQELKEDSTFCDKCGTKVETLEETKAVKEEEKKATNSVLLGILILAVVFVTVFGIIMIAVTMNNNNDNGTSNTNNSLTNLFQKKATTNDIIMEYQEIPSISGAAKYYAILQANEKINDLIIEIDFLDQNKSVLKTERIEIGKVAPGNEYKLQLDQSGIAINQLDKTTSFKVRVVNGYITE